MTCTLMSQEVSIGYTDRAPDQHAPEISSAGMLGVMAQPGSKVTPPELFEVITARSTPSISQHHAQSVTMNKSQGFSRRLAQTQVGPAFQTLMLV